jgi:D-glycero-alpha-D-manno-heptose-7-phosphate kinase
MIISQTPYRVSFAGGGTDLPAFYRQEFGAVLSTTIDQHIYVTIHRRFEPTIRVSYSRTELASTLEEVQHELVREAMRRVEIDEPLEITTIGDVPAGTGMGSSSSLTVGLLAALYGSATGWSAPGCWRSRPAGSRSRSWASRSAVRTSTPPPSAG